MDRTELTPRSTPTPRIGVVLGKPGGFSDSWASLSSEYDRAVAAGFDSVWLTQYLGFDALTLLAAWAARETSGPELGTAVIPAPTRHPLMLAQHALSVQAVSGGRLALGIGLGHRRTLDEAFGVATPRSVAFLNDYLDVLQPVMAGAEMKPSDTFPPCGALLCELSPAPPVLVAALGPRMLELTGARADGTITWMTGPMTLAEHIVPTIVRSAAEHSRPSPRVVACLPVCVTDNADAVRAHFGRAYDHYNGIPSYAAMLAREGAAGPADITLVGNEQDVGAAIDALFESGVTDFAAMIEAIPPSEFERTWDLLTHLASSLRLRRASAAASSDRVDDWR